MSERFIGPLEKLRSELCFIVDSIASFSGRSGHIKARSVPFG